MPELTNAEWRRLDTSCEDLNLLLKRLKRKYPNACFKVTDSGQFLVFESDDPTLTGRDSIGHGEISDLSCYRGPKFDWYD